MRTEFLCVSVLRVASGPRMFFVSKNNHFNVYFTTLLLVSVPCGGRRTYFTIVQVIFSFPLGSYSQLWYLWKWGSVHVYARGRKQCCKLLYCLW